jgi:UDP-N-acetylmuramyl pentapeptide phosphotransferase/UDP-N-acetylglucosamine-1-phosphate transferase
MSAVLVASLAAFLAAVALTRYLCHPDARFRILDHPNERSLHHRPISRTGGVAILIGIVIGLAPFTLGQAFLALSVWLPISVTLLAMISFIDDRYGVDVMVRLAVQVIAVCLLLFDRVILPEIQLPGVVWHWPVILSVSFSILYALWTVNLYNFMDGMDGFAAGMAVIGFGCLAVFGWLAGNVLFFNLSLIIMAASAGFLVFNFPPARIFMGDVGSSLLGLLAAALSLWGAREGIFPFWAALLVFSPFIVDATATLIRRLFSGEKVWQAHKTHYYQRLVQLGWGHRKTVLWEYGLMVACAISALWAVRQTVITQWLILSVWVVLYSLLMLWIPRLEEKNRK